MACDAWNVYTLRKLAPFFVFCHSIFFLRSKSRHSVENQFSRVTEHRVERLEGTLLCKLLHILFSFSIKQEVFNFLFLSSEDFVRFCL